MRRERVVLPNLTLTDILLGCNPAEFLTYREALSLRQPMDGRFPSQVVSVWKGLMPPKHKRHLCTFEPPLLVTLPDLRMLKQCPTEKQGLVWSQSVD